MTNEEITAKIEEKAKALFDAGKATTLAEAKTMAEGLLSEKDKTFAEQIKGLKDALAEKDQEQKEAIKGLQVKLDQSDKLRDEALTKMNRIKEVDRETRKKTLQSALYDSLDEHQEKLKNWSGSKKSFDIEMKAVTAMGVVSGSVAPEFNAPVGVAHELVHARNVIPVSPTQSNLIKYIQFTRKEGAIAPVAAGAVKPDFDYTQTVKEAAVRKIAGHLTVHDEFLEDVVGARDFLATELPEAYLDVEDSQIFKGAGTGENLLGLYTNAEALVLPLGEVTSASNRWDKIAASLAQVRRNLRASSAIWLSPEDYMSLLINKGNTDEYTYPIVSDVNGQLRMGGVPIYQHSVFAEGEGLVGDFVRGTRIFQKMGMTIKFSTEHASNFTTNLTTILIEARIALPIYFPESFVKLDFGTT